MKHFAQSGSTTVNPINSTVSGEHSYFGRGIKRRCDVERAILVIDRTVLLV